MINAGTEIHFLIEPICLIYSVSRRIIRGKLINSRKAFKILYQRAKNLSWKYQKSKVRGISFNLLIVNIKKE